MRFLVLDRQLLRELYSVLYLSQLLKFAVIDTSDLSELKVISLTGEPVTTENVGGYVPSRKFGDCTITER